ncbi:hypothetical protein E143388_04807 [Rhodococcus opacus]|nr:hypothetical protein E143388_04807 [Rhodococcus opacus]
MLLEASFGTRAITQNWHRPDVVLCVSPALIAAAMAVARARGQRSRPSIGIWVQDLYSRGLIETGAANGRIAQAAAKFESATLRAADGVAVIHDRFRSYMANTLKIESSKIEVIRNWTHLRVGPTRSRVQTRSLLGWGPDETVVLHSGNMGAKQGLENVIEAAKQAFVNYPSIRFVLLGDGNQRARLESLCPPGLNLQFLNPMSDFDFRSALDAADVLLVNELPGVTEMAVPSKLTTYFATGKPVLAATDRTSTTAEELANSGGGVQVPAGSPEELIKEIIQLSSDDAYAAAFGRAGLAYYRTTLSETSAIDSFEEWIYKIHSAKREVRSSAGADE